MKRGYRLQEPTLHLDTRGGGELRDHHRHLVTNSAPPRRARWRHNAGYGSLPTSINFSTTDNKTWIVTFIGNTDAGVDGLR